MTCCWRSLSQPERQATTNESGLSNRDMRKFYGCLGALWPGVFNTFVSTPYARTVRRRVVVIDDNHDAADTTAILVEELGGECRVAYDGLSGVREVVSYRP